MRKWNFPANLCNAIRYHHTPHLSEESFLETAIVHVADVLVRAKGIGIASEMKILAKKSPRSCYRIDRRKYS